MSYQVFARKFRPQSFDEVIGQEHITTTLKNAIKKGRIAQSFLFSGSRGVGKTSTARILAKALNCQKGLTENPCGKCPSCDEITRGSSLDVLEIDGASNRGIDEIRSLRDNVKFKPANGRYKIYIIDEVHMLTGEAFNALLKTLEEPPEHVKFIFATTESHKVPLTILSRCQRFSFRRVATSLIHEKLKEISKKEKIKAGDKTLFLIAKSAEGSLRDGEGLLDQMSSFGEGEIKEEDVLFSLGLTSDETYLKLINAVELRKSKEILSLINELADQGKDIEQFLKGFLEYFRDLLVLKLGDVKSDFVERDENSLAELRKYSESFKREELFLILSLLQQLLREIKWSRSPRYLLEICLLKIANREELSAIQDILTELRQLAKQPVDFLPAQSGPSNPPAPSFQDKKKLTERPEVKLGFFQPAKPQLKNPEESNVSVYESREIGFEEMERAWPELLSRVKTTRMSIGTYLSESEPLEVAGNKITFGFPVEFKFHKETLDHQNNKSFIQKTLEDLLRTRVQIEFVITKAEKIEKVAQQPEQAKTDDSEVILSALDIFQGSKVIRKV